jgi:hypothetical protein
LDRRSPPRTARPHPRMEPAALPHLRHILREYEAHHNGHRPHMTLARAAPDRPLPPEVARSGSLTRPPLRPRRRRHPRIPTSRLTCEDEVFGKDREYRRFLRQAIASSRSATGSSAGGWYLMSSEPLSMPGGDCGVSGAPAAPTSSLTAHPGAPTFPDAACIRYRLLGRRGSPAAWMRAGRGRFRTRSICQAQPSLTECGP